MHNLAIYIDKEFLDAEYVTDDLENEVDGYPGFFRANARFLVSDVYPLLMVGVYAGDVWRAEGILSCQILPTRDGK